MPLQPQVESLEGIPEDLQGEYEQTDSGYRLKILAGFVPADRVEDVSGLKSALHKERENAREAGRVAKQLREQYAGFDVEELEKLREDQQRAEEERAKKAGEFDTLRVQMNEKHAQEIAARDDKIGALTKAYDDVLIDSAVLQAINESKGNALFLKPLVTKQVQVVQDEAGKFALRVVDDAGNPRVDGEGKYLTVNALVREMREQETYAPAFLGAGSTGGGTPPGAGEGQGGGGKGGIPSDLKRGTMSTKQKVDFIKQHGNVEFQKLPA